jgi:uncharacterized protein YwqG
VFTSEDQIAAALIEAGVKSEDARRIAKEARPCVWLETRSAGDEAEIPAGATKIGGRPDLPDGVEWPVRPAYTNESRVARYRRELEDPKKFWSWASPDQREKFASGAAQMLEIVSKPFPLAFIAQIDLTEAWRAGPLDPDFPRDGLLSVFYDVLEAPWGYDPADAPGARVLYHPVGGGCLTRRDPPAELSGLSCVEPFPPAACHARACLAPLPIQTAHYAALRLSRETTEALGEWWGEDDNMYASEGGRDWKCHRVGGWPTPVQGDMQTECALVSAGFYCGNGDAYRAPETEGVRARADEWVLLAQIGTDEGAGMMWGDDGQLYIWIRREDLVLRRFEAARLVLQCY